MEHEDTKTQSAQRTSYKILPPRTELVGKAVVNTAYAVHKALGPGLLESVYEACLVRELELQGYRTERQVLLPVRYADIVLQDALRIDLIVENCVIIELKAVDEMHPVFKAQLLTYLKLSSHRLGYLINFNIPLIRDGIKRYVF